MQMSIQQFLDVLEGKARLGHQDGRLLDYLSISETKGEVDSVIDGA